MTLEQIAAILATTTLPVTYRAWPVGEAPQLPWIAYIETGSDNFAADGIAYGLIKTVDIELYTKAKDPATEALVEKALTDAGIFWQKTETYIEGEAALEIVYEIEV